MNQANKWIKEQKEMLISELKAIKVTKRTWRYWQLDTEWALDELIGVAEMELPEDVFEDWYSDAGYKNADFLDLVEWQAAYNETESGFQIYNLNGNIVNMERYTIK